MLYIDWINCNSKVSLTNSNPNPCICGTNTLLKLCFNDECQSRTDDNLNKIISVIIPCYNEEMNVGPIYKRLCELYDNYICEFIFVDDNSTDKTSDIIKCEYILCTGLFDEYSQDLNYYKKILKSEINKKMICTNPDLIVDKGEKREYCAGSVAKIFEDLGGVVEYFGKPHKEIYRMCFNNKENVLAYSLYCSNHNICFFVINF